MWCLFLLQCLIFLKINFIFEKEKQDIANHKNLKL